MSADEAKRRGCKILARLVATGYHAQAPERFTTAPAPAIQNALKKAGWDAKQVDLWEINEAFSVVSLYNNYCARARRERRSTSGAARSRSVTRSARSRARASS